MDEKCVYYAPKKDKITILHPPEKVINAICENPNPPIKILEGVSDLPLLLPSGEIISELGYHSDSKLYITKEVDVGVLKGPYDQMAAIGALARLKDVLCDFPFDTEASRSVVLSSVLTATCRNTFDGPAPLFVFDAPTPGSGKSLLADIVVLITKGGPAPRMTLSNDEEMQKVITATLMAGIQIALFDNISKRLGGSSLDAFLTAEEWQGRVLQFSKM